YPSSYYYSSPSYYYPSDYYYDYCPIGLSLQTMPSATVLRTQPAIVEWPSTMEVVPAPGPLPKDGTYPYDGGPKNPVPMPRADPAPTANPAPATPDPNRLVSIPAKPAKHAYP